MMESIDAILEQLESVEVAVRCRKCGAVPQLVGRQFSVRCTVCGMEIRVTKSYLARLKTMEYRARNGTELRLPPAKCNICMDSGIAFIEEQVNDTMQENGYRCICMAGQKREDLNGWPVLPLSKARPRLTLIKGGQEVQDKLF